VPRLAPLGREDLIKYLKALGFDGPFSGAKHELMIRGQTRLTLPNPDRADIGREYLARILRQAGISRKEWERL
jgi:predicted RNA binding protein YcfA (HicA-like mRNA interferase family)